MYCYQRRTQTAASLCPTYLEQRESEPPGVQLQPGTRNSPVFPQRIRSKTHFGMRMRLLAPMAPPSETYTYLRYKK